MADSIALRNTPIIELLGLHNPHYAN
jgi:ribosomal protein S16